jgi:phage terminase large subunit-like protein
VPFDEDKAERAVRFIETYLCHTKGERYYRKPFKLAPWQKEPIRKIFGTVDEEGHRVIRQVFWETPKKNGKSQIAAAIALYLLYADREMSAEVYGAGADRDQAGIIFQMAASMVRANPKLRSRSKVIDSSKRIVVPAVESFYRALSAEVAGKHGFNSHGVIFDEIHAQKNRQLWEVLTFGAGAARTQPLTFGITTAGIPGESPVAEELHDLADQTLRGVVPEDSAFYPIIYAAPNNADWRDEEVWRACNPALGDFLDIRAVREEYNRACRLPSEQNSFRRLRLNQWVAQETRFIDMADWDKCNGPVNLDELCHLPCYAGLDLSTKLDITALVLVFLDGDGRFHLFPTFWLPEENLGNRPNQETAKYKVWKEQGYLRTTRGNVIDYGAVRDRLNEFRDQNLDIREVAFDPWNATQFAQHLQEDGFTAVEIPQNFRHLSEATKELQSAAMQGNLRHGGHPVLRWMADCMTVKQDSNGNVRPVKPDRLKHSKRIDGVVAGVMGIARAMVRGGEQRRSVYESRDVLYVG